MDSFCSLMRRKLLCHRRLFAAVAWGLLVAMPALVAHPMPNSLVSLDIEPQCIRAEIHVPLIELALAFGGPLTAHSFTVPSDTDFRSHRQELEAYILRHIKPTSGDGAVWDVRVDTLTVDASENAINGVYQELHGWLTMTPPAGRGTQDMILHYDLVMHQVVTHSALVAVRQDWDAGIVGGQIHNGLLSETPLEVSVIAWDIRSNTLPLFVLHRQQDQSRPEERGLWQGVKRMILLGMRHIAAGTDHVLFLIVLLLAAPLVASGRARRWGTFGGVRYAVRRLVVIVTAFTLGHSLTLLLGALNLVRLPQSFIELCIAFSIVVSAIHATWPIFAGREALIAAGFGLLHGLAFAEVLTNLHLDTMRLLLSVGSFNLGIELMQLGIIALVAPWLILLSQTRPYNAFRVVCAGCAAIAAVAWMQERWSGIPNTCTTIFANAMNNYVLLAMLWAGFVVTTLVVYWLNVHRLRKPVDSSILVSEE
jgi:hypothetical protein